MAHNQLRALAPAPPSSASVSTFRRGKNQADHGAVMARLRSGSPPGQKVRLDPIIGDIMPPKTDPLYKRPEMHFVWWSLIVAIVLGTATWVGVPGMAFPMALLFLGLILTIAYVWMMLPTR